MNFSLFTTTCCIDILVFLIILEDKFQKYYKRELLVLMGSHFLKERHRGIRLTGSLIIFTGGFLISLAR